MKKNTQGEGPGPGMKMVLRSTVYSLPVLALSAIAAPAGAESYSFVGSPSTTLTYAPSIISGTNTNISSYSSSFKWIYSLYSFTVNKSGAYSATSTTTGVVNTTFFLNGTFNPTATFPPSTPISQFIVSNFSGGNTATFSGVNLVAGQTYSVLVAYNQTTAGVYPYTVTLFFDGPGCIAINSRTCVAADQTGKPNANMPTSAVDVSRAFGKVISSRLGALRSGGGSIAPKAASGLNSLSFNQSGGFSDAAFGVASAADGGEDGVSTGEGYQNDRHGMWARAFGGYSTNYGNSTNPGYKRMTSGALVGTDLPVTDTTRVGVAVGYGYSDITGRQNSGGTTADSYHASVYGDWTPGPWFVTGDIGATYNMFEGNRTVVNGASELVANSKSNAIDIGTGIEAGYRAKMGDLTVEPSVSLRYDMIHSNAYTETGADGFNLSVEDATHHALSTGLGFKVSQTFTTDSGVQLEPDVSLRWEHDLRDTGFVTNQTLNGVTTGVKAANPGRDAAVIGLGLAAVLDDDLKLYAHYDTEVRSRQTDHTLTAGARITW